MFKRKKRAKVVGTSRYSKYPLLEVDKIWLNIGDAVSAKDIELGHEKVKNIGLQGGLYPTSHTHFSSHLYPCSAENLYISYVSSADKDENVNIICSYPLITMALAGVKRSMYGVTRHEIFRWETQCESNRTYLMNGKNYPVRDVVDYIQKISENNISLQHIILILCAMRIHNATEASGMSIATLQEYVRLADVMPISVFEEQAFMSLGQIKSNDGIFISEDTKISFNSLREEYVQANQSSVSFSYYFDMLLPQSKNLKNVS